MKSRFNLFKNIFLSNFKRLPYPYKITFALTYRCNLRCEICRIWDIPYKEELKTSEIENLFKNIKNLNWLDLTGGEITLREDLLRVIRLIIKNSKNLLVFHISTNGQLSEKIFLLAKEILKFGILPIINVSIDGPKKINDRLRGRIGSYDRSLETFKLLKTIDRGYFYISCTVSKYNLDYIDEFISGLKNNMSDFSLSDLHFNLFHNSSHYYNNESINGFSEIKFLDVEKYLNLSQNGNFIKKLLERLYAKNLEKYLGKDRYPVTCQALKSTCFINPYGEVFPCGFYNRSIGNLKGCNYDLNKLWNSPYAFRVRKDIENKTCIGCWTPCEAYPAILGNIGKIKNFFKS